MKTTLKKFEKLVLSHQVAPLTHDPSNVKLILSTIGS